MSSEFDNDYSTLEIDLSDAKYVNRTKVEIVQNGKAIAAVTVLQLPVAAVGHVFLRFGPSGDRIIMRQEAITFGRNPARTNGLYLDTDAGMAGILILMIGVDTQQVLS